MPRRSGSSFVSLLWRPERQEDERGKGREEERRKERERLSALSLRADSGCVYARMRKRRRDEKSDNSPATLRPLAASRAPYRSPDTRLSRKPGPTNWPL